MLKKILIFYMVVVCALSLFACDTNKNAAQNNDVSMNVKVESEVGETAKIRTTQELKTVIEYENSNVVEDFDSIRFGKYEQDNDVNNGPEDIEWVVLNKDGNKLLLLSKYILDKYEYNDNHEVTEWKDSMLRNWLNASFYDVAFDEKEKDAIVRNHYQNGAVANGTVYTGRTENVYELSPTDDLVTLLGYQEMLKYIGTVKDNDKAQLCNRRLAAKATEYAKTAKGTYGIVIDVAVGSMWYSGSSPWWLRSMFSIWDAHTTNTAARVESDTMINYANTDDAYTGVRPMILVDFDKLDDEKKNYVLLDIAKKENNKVNSDQLPTETDNPIKLNDWEMDRFAQSLNEFKHKFDDEKQNNSYSNNTKPKYVSETDGSTIFTYGLKDVDKDNVKELFIYNRDNVLAIYKLQNDYYPDTPEYNDKNNFWPVEVSNIPLWHGTKDEYKCSLLDNGYIYEYYSQVTEYDFSDDREWFDSLSEQEKKETWDYRNYVDYTYVIKYVNEDSMEWLQDFSYTSTNPDGKGSFTDNSKGDYQEKRMTKEEAEKLFNSFGKPVILSGGSMVLR